MSPGAAWFDLGVEIPEFIEHLADEGERLAAAAGRVGWDTPVPRTDWNVRDLVTHIGGVHRWAGDVVRTGATDLDTAAGQDVGRGPGDDELLEWFVAGHAALVSALRCAPPDLAAATFLPAPSPLHFWARRQAHETAIHRADADAACRRAVDLRSGVRPGRHRRVAARLRRTQVHDDRCVGDDPPRRSRRAVVGGESGWRTHPRRRD